MHEGVFARIDNYRMIDHTKLGCGLRSRGESIENKLDIWESTKSFVLLER
jgi:hypothetical protein